MKEPKEITECPFCECGLVHTLKRKFKHIPKNNPTHVFEGDWYYYNCVNCDESFTTTESDTISQENLKQRKL